jgi:hypothetical protein
MPFIAICPHCRLCRLRAPRSKRGQTVRCPKCSEEFPLFPYNEETNSTAQSNLDDVESSASASLTSAVSRTHTSETESQGDELLPLAKLALSLAALVLFLSQLPYGRPAALLIAVLGCFASTFTLLELRKQNALVGVAGLMLNGFFTTVLIGYPATLGITGWWSESDRLARESEKNQEEDWIDAGDAGWKQGGVRVSVTFATIGGYPSSNGSSGTKEAYLWVGFKITNVGVGRDLEFSGWEGKSADDLKMTTSDGTLLINKQFMGSPGMPAIQAGHSQECMLAFEIPPPGQDLLLYLPTQPFGDTTIIRFRIPHILIGRQ